MSGVLKKHVIDGQPDKVRVARNTGRELVQRTSKNE
jgi:hypothetical protein